MSKKEATSRRQLRKRQRYTEAEVRLIAEFVLAKREDALNALQACQAMNAAAPHLPGTAGSVDYWLRITQACDWLLHRLTQRQRHLPADHHPEI